MTSTPPGAEGPWELLSRTLPVGRHRLVLLDAGGRVVARCGGAAASAREFFGVELDPGVDLRRCVQPADAAEFERNLAAALRGEHVWVQRELPSPGGPVSFDFDYVPLRDAAGEVSRVLFVSTRTTQGALEHALAHEAERRFRSLLDAIEAPAAMVDPAGVVDYANAALERLAHAEPGGLRGRFFGAAAVAPVHAERFAAALATVVDRRRAGAFEAELPPGAGGPRLLSWHAVWRPGADGRTSGVTLVGDDVTERRRAALAERMASLGTLAAGAAHELNNPLAYVTANLVHALERLRAAPAGAPLPEGEVADLCGALEDALDGASRLRDIVAKLGTFARGGRGDPPRPVAVSGEIDSAVALSRHEIAVRARLELDVAPGLPPVLAGAHELGQVLVNLLVNAAHAIPEGDAGRHRVRLHARREADGVLLEVSDTGRGIAPEDVPRIFDPFFTTKPVGQGTGLGLAICHGLVARMGGTIEVESLPGRGATFRVRLPSAAPAPAPGGEAPGAPPRAPRPARILVVDDEPLVSRAIRRILSPPHDVVTVASGADALRQLDAGVDFDVVLCDLVMLGDGGAAFLQRAEREAALAARTVYMTGGAFTPGAAAVAARAGVTVLQKPMSADALRRLVAERVAARAGRPPDP